MLISKREYTKNDRASKVKKILILQCQFDAKVSIMDILMPLIHCYEFYCLFRILTILLFMISDKFQLYSLGSVVL
jgi:hypothetical protein